MDEAKIYLKIMILLLFLAVGCVTINIAKDIHNWHEWNETKTVFTVIVQEGDTLYNYGYQYKPDWMDIRDYCEEVKELNNMSSSTICAYQDLKLYRGD